MPAMTIRQRIEAALKREPVDQVPFTTYPVFLPRGEAERTLREHGLGFAVRTGVIVEERPNVSIETHEYTERGVLYRRTLVSTPVGEVYATHRLGAAYGTAWYVDHFVKRPEDYRAVEFMIRDTIYRADYSGFNDAVEAVGSDGYVIGNFGYSPLMEMRVNLLGIERFSMDEYDHPDLFQSLYGALREKQREAYPLLAQSPADLVIYCGNCSPEVLGRERFRRYILPCYDELGKQLHANGKLLGCHLDANNRLWASLVADSQLDVIEAFTPSPDTDMSVAEARAAWPGKVLWVNFPSSLHLATAERICDATRQMVREASGRGLIIGITEDIPPAVWRTSLAAIAHTLEQEAAGA